MEKYLAPEHLYFMNLVYEEVEIAIQTGNPPFAALIIDSSNTIIAKTHNQSHSKNCMIAHAEIEAIHIGCRTLEHKRLDGCTMYVNAESCAMCATAIIKVGIDQIFYGAAHEAGSNPNIYLNEINEWTDPKLRVFGGIMEEKFAEQILRGRRLINTLSCSLQ